MSRNKKNEKDMKRKCAQRKRRQSKIDWKKARKRRAQKWKGRGKGEEKKRNGEKYNRKY